MLLNNIRKKLINPEDRFSYGFWSCAVTHGTSICCRYLTHNIINNTNQKLRPAHAHGVQIQIKLMFIEQQATPPGSNTSNSSTHRIALVLSDLIINKLLPLL